MADTHPARPTPPGLAKYWQRPLREFVTLPAHPIEDGLRERHALYSLLTLAVLASQWNGNKYGSPGDYGSWRRNQLAPGVPPELGVYGGGTYLGHNIAAIAVDARGRVVDFDFNHNQIFNSSVEHAESRLLRRLFSLSLISESWGPAGAAATPPERSPSGSPRQAFLLAVSAPPTAAEKLPRRTGYSKLLTDVTIYTSLESCAQCSGIMTLADVREVVYLQPDQGQYLIGNIMFRATTTPDGGSRAPEPVAAAGFDFPFYDRLVAAHGEFAKRVRNEPFFRDASGRRTDGSVTSFLCTDLALDVVQAAAEELAGLTGLKAPAYVRPSRDGTPVPGGLSNEGVLAEVRDFLRYVKTEGGRGTAHRA